MCQNHTHHHTTNNETIEETKTEEGMCSICLNHSNLVSSNYTHCPANHPICKNCFSRVIKICFCDRPEGKLIYECPLCRNSHSFGNKELYHVRRNLYKSPILYVTPHEKCKHAMQIPNFIRKCIFRKCGCREQSKDLVINSNVSKAFNELVELMSPKQTYYGKR